MQVFAKKKKGFTLIELLVVISIIGLLATVVIVAIFGPARAKGRDARRMADIHQINLAMEMCYDDATCNVSYKYPATTAGINTVTQIDTDGAPLYLKVPCDPTGCDVGYTWTANAPPFQYYCVYVKLEAEPDTWFCTSNKGTMKKTAAAPYVPNNTDCCGVNVIIP